MTTRRGRIVMSLDVLEVVTIDTINFASDLLELAGVPLPSLEELRTAEIEALEHRLLPDGIEYERRVDLVQARVRAELAEILAAEPPQPPGRASDLRPPT